MPAQVVHRLLNRLFAETLLFYFLFVARHIASQLPRLTQYDQTEMRAVDGTVLACMGTAAAGGCNRYYTRVLHADSWRSGVVNNVRRDSG